jgi:hypothetical protein
MNEKEKKIIKAKIGKNESKIFKKNEDFYEGFNALFYFILKNPLDNFWWECFSIIIQYIQLTIFTLDEKVSIFIF